MKTLLPIALAALPLMANAAPAFLPNQDVAVTYALSTPGRTTQDYQLSYLAAGQLARIDSQSGFYILGNLQTGAAMVVVPALHALVKAPDFSVLTADIQNAGTARFTLLGTGHYAGLDCQKYLVLAQNGSGTACITQTGVVLHFAGQNAHGQADISALSVTYGPQSESDFSPPAGFNQLQMPPGALESMLSQ